MSQCVVHVLEPVEIDQKERKLPVVALRHRKRVRQPFMEQRPIGKRGQRIMGGDDAQLLVGPPAFLDVAIDQEANEPEQDQAAKRRHVKRPQRETRALLQLVGPALDLLGLCRGDPIEQLVHADHYAFALRRSHGAQRGCFFSCLGVFERALELSGPFGDQFLQVPGLVRFLDPVETPQHPAQLAIGRLQQLERALEVILLLGENVVALPGLGSGNRRPYALEKIARLQSDLYRVGSLGQRNERLVVDQGIDDQDRQAHPETPNDLLGNRSIHRVLRGN